MRDQGEILWRIKICWVAGGSPQRLMPMISQLDDAHAAALTRWIRTGRGGAALGGAMVVSRRRGAVPQGQEQLYEAAHRAWLVACRRLVRHSPLASDSIAQLYEWLWLLGADEACKAMARAPWRVNGAPKLRAAARHMRRWPWGVDATDPALLLMAAGQPCRPGCERGCPTTEPLLTPVDDVTAAAAAAAAAVPQAPPDPPAATGRKGMHIAQTPRPARSWGTRLVAGVIALLLATALVVAAVASPARAAGAGGRATVDAASTCEALQVTIDPGRTRRTWVVTATVDGADWTWPAGDLAPAGHAPGNGWIAGDPHTVAVPAGATGVDVTWWHGQGDPDPAADGWVVALDEAAWTHPGGEACGTPAITVEQDSCPAVSLAFTNPTEFFFSGDVRVDGEAGVPDQWSDMEVKQGPHAGELFGDRYRPVDIPPGQTARFDVSFDDFSGEHQVEYVIRRGAEQDWYVPWGQVTVDCGTPQPTPTPTAPGSPEKEATAGDGGQLPETGTSVLLIGAAALALIATGTGAVLVVRRRRVHFRA